MRLQQAFCAIGRSCWDCSVVHASYGTGRFERRLRLKLPRKPRPPLNDEVIHLHMPVHHSVHHRTPQAAAPASVDAIGANLAPPPMCCRRTAETAISSAPKTKRVSNPAPAPAIPLSLGDEGNESPLRRLSPYRISGTARGQTASIPPHDAAPAHSPSPHAATGDSRAALTNTATFCSRRASAIPRPRNSKA